MQPIKINKEDIKGINTLEAYYKLIEEKKISFDSEQEKVAKMLFNLESELKEYQPLQTY